MLLLNTFQKYIKCNRQYSVKFAYLLNKIGVYFQGLSRKIIQCMNSETSDQHSEWFLLNRSFLLKEIKKILQRQKTEYKHYSYFYDYPYQAFSTLGVFGERSTEERYKIYNLDQYLDSNSKILDLGCNCGFMGIYASYRKGCEVTGIDINPYAIEIGNLCAKYLGLSKKVTLQPCKVQDLDKTQRFNALFSFATHWTDDKNYRVQLSDHFKMIHDLLESGGLVFFESHCADVGDPKYYEAINNLKDIFEVLFIADTDANSRHYHIFKKR